jgi:hypothetical protein
MSDIISLVVAFAAGIVVGTFPLVLRALRRAGPPGSTAAPQESGRPLRRYGLRVAAVSVVATLAVIAAAAYVVVRVLTSSAPMANVGVDQAVAQFEGSGGAATSTAHPQGPLGPPRAGVYTYRASGSWTTTVPVFGTERRVLPATVPAVLQADGDGWTLAFAYFDKHHTTLSYRGSAGPELEESAGDTDSVRFGFRVRSSMTCSPDVVVRPVSPGTSWDQDCRGVTRGVISATQDLPSTTTLMGIDRLDVGGTPVDAWHVHRATKVVGSETGTLLSDSWYSTADGLLLRLETQSRTSGLVDHVEAIRLDLASLTPRT